GYAITHPGDHSGALVTGYHEATAAGAAFDHVDVAVADTGGEHAHLHLAGARIAHLELVGEHQVLPVPNNAAHRPPPYLTYLFASLLTACLASYRLRLAAFRLSSKYGRKRGQSRRGSFRARHRCTCRRYALTAASMRAISSGSSGPSRSASRHCLSS